MNVSAGYVLRVFVCFTALLLAYPRVVPIYATMTVAPLDALIGPLQAVPRDGRHIRFEWPVAGRWQPFSEVDFESLSNNVVVLTALLLALQRPWRRRLSSVLKGWGLLYAFNAAHLGVILLHDHHAASGATGTDGFLWGAVSIAYHMGGQIGTMVIPFVAFLLLTLRQKPMDAKSDGSAPAAAAPRSRSA
jgi:hypothetical protein